MATDTLDIYLGARKVGAIIGLGGDRSVFAFDESYADDPGRPILSLSFKDAMGDLIRDQRRTQTRLSPYFSNLLPEGPLRTYLAERAGVSAVRELPLLRALGPDLPGAVIARASEDAIPGRDPDEPDAASVDGPGEIPLRFSLAGVQLKFSAVEQARGGLTIPVGGAGGSWIVKLPSTHFPGVSENEFSMMTLAKAVGIDAPEIRLLPIERIAGLPEAVGALQGAAYAVRRFDRGVAGERIHTEDFAQVFGVYPDEKYRRATYRSIARVLWLETGEAGATEFIRRLVFNALIGNADMHLKNWSLLYADGVTPTLAPAYDLVCTLAYIADDKAALKVARTARWEDFSEDELRYMAAKASLPERLAVDVARDSVEAFREVWAKARGHLPLPGPVAAVIDRQLDIVPIARGRGG